jgi:hypothetical protein
MPPEVKNKRNGPTAAPSDTKLSQGTPLQTVVSRGALLANSKRLFLFRIADTVETCQSVPMPAHSNT